MSTSPLTRNIGHDPAPPDADSTLTCNPGSTTAISSSFVVPRPQRPAVVPWFVSSVFGRYQSPEALHLLTQPDDAIDRLHIGGDRRLFPEVTALACRGRSTG